MLDVRNVRVGQGQFYFRTPSGNGVRVVPCHGVKNIPESLERFLRQRNTSPFAKLVINVDADDNADKTANSASSLKPIAIENLVRAADANLQTTAEGTYAIDKGTAEIALIRWTAQDANISGIPNQQTLERLVCAAICTAYPQRGQHIQNFLNERHEPPKIGVKEFAWTHMAGWYAEHGCDDFYRCLWDDARVAAELKARLQSSGAWQIAEALTA